MKEVQFAEKRQPEWEAWDRWLAGREQEGSSSLALAELPGSFRRLNHDLPLAKERRYSAFLVEALQRRVLLAHQRVYGASPVQGNSLIDFLSGGLPQLVRDEWRYVTAAALLFFLPLGLMVILAQFDPDVIFRILNPEQAYEMQRMYAPDAPHLGRPRAASSEWAMWGFYIANNVRIDFQCFAGGMLFGVGAIFFLLYNGLVIGAVAGHMTQLGYIETFWGFVAGHSAFELTGAVLAGAAGLRVGYALVAPGRFRRLLALQRSAIVAGKLLAGAALLTFLAAFIEAFWSPERGIPSMVKYGFGLALWLLTWSYLMLAGKRHAA